MPTPTNRIVENKPTAGPWRVEDVGIPGTLAIMAGSTTEYHWIATVAEDMGSGVDWTQTQANAQLIAQVPELLAALHEIMNMQQHIYTEGDEGKPKRLPAALAPYSGPLSIIFRVAYGAIAKAESCEP